MKAAAMIDTRRVARGPPSSVLILALSLDPIIDLLIKEELSRCSAPLLPMLVDAYLLCSHVYEEYSIVKTFEPSTHVFPNTPSRVCFLSRFPTTLAGAEIINVVVENRDFRYSTR